MCLGNICRSPTAEGVMRDLLIREGLEDEVEIDSAGTGAWHVGSAPDSRASSAAGAHGVTLAGQAREVTHADFEDFDLIVAMDGSNLEDLRHLAHGDAQTHKLRLLREFDPPSVAMADLDVPDPYQGGEEGFDDVYEIVLAGCKGLLAGLRSGALS